MARRRLAGACMAALGLVILLGMILPPGFWWVLLALALIGGGVALLRCR